ncbi:MAG: exopolysaccharide biosynthesis polyprenyl glycosylphosphotransferase [Ilumatobacteraceae bacterium]
MTMSDPLFGFVEDMTEMLVGTKRLPAEVAAEANEGHRRGPLRPDRLVSVRQRQDRRLAAHRFRAADTVVLAVVAVLVFRSQFARPVLEAPSAEVVPVVVGVWSTWWLLRSLGLYRFGRSERLLPHLARVAAATLAGATIAVVVHRLVPAEASTTSDVVALMAFCGACLLILHTVWWWRVTQWRSLGLLTPNLVVVGATKHAEDLIATALDRRDMNILGIFDDRSGRAPPLRQVPVLGTTESMLGHRVMPFVDLIVVAIDPAATERVRQIMDRLAVLPNNVTLLFDGPAASRRAAAIDRLADAPLAPLHPATDAARRAFAKRVQDLAFGIPALILLAPLMAVIALAIRLDSPGPIIFRQRRHGFNNEEIVVWKFRTMRHDAADARAERQVIADDDRVTRVGRVLRKASLDELPQLINVMIGEMSLVGPRPHAIGMKTGGVESDRLVAEYAHRHRIKPGMTGWAAVNGSRGPLHEPEEVERRVALDVAYIERQSTWLDLEILLMTIPQMLGDRAAVR